MSVDLSQYRRVDNLEEMQNMLRDLMHELHTICENHGLSYSITDGTLLGAVRHNDIIPWDDDIDIIMPRPDYNKLMTIIQQNYAEEYILYNYPCDGYIYPYGKFCKKGTLLFEKTLDKKYSQLALYIDIFPLDGFPVLTEKQSDTMFSKAEKYKNMTARATGRIFVSSVWWKKPFVIFRWLQKMLLNIPGYKYYLKKQIDITKTYAFEDCDDVGFISSWIGGRQGIISKQEFYDQQLYSFGQYSFWGIKNYDKKLKGLYGDYMTPPPIHQRTAPHAYDLYVKEDNRAN